MITKPLAEIKSDTKTVATDAPITVGDPAMAASLAIDQSHMEEFTHADERSADVQFGKPPKGIYFTVYRETTKQWQNRAFFFVLEMEGRDSYIVAPHIAKEKAEEDVIRPVLIVRFVTMGAGEGLWPLKLDQPDAKSNRWNVSALNILEEAESGWVRMISAKKSYRFQRSTKTLEQTPARFSNRPFQDLVNFAFKDRIITSLDHEIWDALDQGSTK